MHKARIIILIMSVFSSISLFSQGRWNCNLGLGANLTTGNVNISSLVTDASVKRNDSLISFDFHYKMIYTSYVAKNSTERKWEEMNFEINGGVMLDLYQYDKYSPFLACEVLTNKYKGYDLKVSGLIGMKVRLFTKPGSYDYSISGAFVYDGVDFSDDTHLPTNNYRISIRPKMKQRLTKNLWFIHQTYYQPSVLDINDFLICSVTNLQNRLSKHFFFDLSFTYEYRSRIPSKNYKHEDILTVLSIRYKI